MNTKNSGENKNFRSVIVAVDFSDTSIKALEYANALAREFGARLLVLHVLEFPAVFNSPKPAYAQWDQRVKETATERLSALMAQKVDKAISATSEVRSGRAYQTICETASESKADLIVIGTHGFTGLKHVVLGSTAERVIRYAPCAVLTLRPQYLQQPKAVTKAKRILVPTDFSEPSAAAFRAAVELAKQNKAEIRLLYVVPVHYASGEYDAVDFPLLESEEADVAGKELATLGQALRDEEIPFQSDIRRGRVAVEINQVAEESESDLIVIATRGRTGLEHVLLGSTTEEVVRHSLCPVLVVRK